MDAKREGVEATVSELVARPGRAEAAEVVSVKRDDAVVGGASGTAMVGGNRASFGISAGSPVASRYPPPESA